MPQFLQALYSTVHYYFTQIPDLHAYALNRVELANYNLNGLTIKIADTEDLRRLAVTVDKFRTSTRIAERIRRGDVCVIAYKHGALAHVRWAAQTPLPLKELSGRVVHLTPHEAYTYDGYTLPMFRRQGIGSEARIFLVTYLAQQGIHRAYAMTRTDNRYTSQSEDKRVREGRIRIIGLIAITTLLEQMRCTYSATTAATRFLLARLFQLPLHTVHVRNPANS